MHVWFLVTCLIFLCCFHCFECNDDKMDKNYVHKVRMKNASEVIRDIWKFEIVEGLEMQLSKEGNRSLALRLHTKDSTEMQRKMKMSMNNMLPYMIIPGFLMAGLLPWILPGIKMVVMAVTMVNQMAFNMALFGLIRSYIFDTEKEEHIVYINHGYRKKTGHTNQNR
nr:PREDICTED: uncharacterized protein LOC103315171 [Tribolium castaneum]|eukprot:XP_008201385.1 PREDICTED: uncharacterized protein LOC103315171 [Tribolium castaneum]